MAASIFSKVCIKAHFPLKCLLINLRKSQINPLANLLASFMAENRVALSNDNLTFEERPYKLSNKVSKSH